MSGPTSEFWWILLVGTIVALTLGIGMVALLFLNERTKARLQREHFALLEENERRYADLFENVSDLVYVHSATGVVLSVNRVASTLLGYPPDALIGKDVTDFLSPGMRPKFVRYLKAVADSMKEVSGVIPVFSRDKSRLFVFEFRSSPVIDNGKTRAVRGIARDITERVSYDRTLRSARRKSELLLHQAVAMQDRLAQLSRQVIQVQENDRLRIGRELHDEIGQTLAAITINLEVLKKDPGIATKDAHDRLQDAQDLTREVMGRVRQVLQDLLPESLDQVGFLPVVRGYLREFSNRTKVAIDFVECPSIELFGRSEKLALYRVLQESLTNIAQHASATSVAVECSQEDGCFVLAIRDNGRGFDPDNVSRNFDGSRPHLGLLGMQERMKLVGGSLDINSKSGRGTALHVRLPMPGK